MPPSFFNLVNGSGPTVGEVLATHPEAGMVGFAGSTRAGKRGGTGEQTFIEQGLQEGADLVAGGPGKPAFDKGYFAQPTTLF